MIKDGKESHMRLRRMLKGYAGLHLSIFPQGGIVPISEMKKKNRSCKQNESGIPRLVS